jgi:hypothetical protein
VITSKNLFILTKKKEIASAIAYEKAGKKKSTQVEALENFIMSLADGSNKTLIENVIMEAFDVCFNSILIEDAIQVTTPTTSPTSSTPSPTTAVLDTTNLSPEQIKLVAAQAQVVADKKAQETLEQQKLQALSAPPTTPTIPSNNNPQKIA